MSRCHQCDSEQTTLVDKLEIENDSEKIALVYECDNCLMYTYWLRLKKDIEENK
jgi:hypothetical protein